MNKNKVIKVICWRIISIFVTFVVMAIATGNIKDATSTTVMLHLLLVICHYFFEANWEKRFEKMKNKELNIGE